MLPGGQPPSLLLLLLLLRPGSGSSSVPPAGPPAAAASCPASTFAAANLSGFRLVGGAEHSCNTTAAECRAACCRLGGSSDQEGGCVAWNYHASSSNPAHNVLSCWLSYARRGYQTPVTRVSHDKTYADDVWVGAARTPVCDDTSGGCAKPPAPAPPPPPSYHGPKIPRCNGTDYDDCRRALWKYVFNTTTGGLPTKAAPDYIVEMADWEMKGLPGPGQGTGVGNVSWKMGLQKLVWEIGRPGGGMRAGMLRLNSTVWFARNTSGDAPSNSPPVPLSGVGVDDSPHCPDARRPGYESWRGRGADGR
jgi:hypothetical protein